MLTPKELAWETGNIGEAKVTKPYLKIFVSAILSGCFVGFGYFGFNSIVGSSSSDFMFLARFLGAIVFTVGIMLIIISGTELFTGNCLLTIGYLNKQYKFRKVIQNLIIVYFGNFMGALLVCFFIFQSHLTTDSVQIYIKEIVTTKANLTFGEAFFRGILCNILVSLAVYISYAGKSVSSRIISVFFPVFLFVLSGYEHSVANMFILPFGKALGADITYSQIFISNLLPVTIGNLIGGGIIVPLAYFYIYVKKTDKKI